jgi:hypothetical protein
MAKKPIQLASGITIAGMVICFTKDKAAIQERGFFHGYTDNIMYFIPVWHACGGLLVSCVLK